MLIGHYGAAFALKSAERRVSLGVLFVATQFVDILWIVLVLAGVEKVRLAPGGPAAAPIEFTAYPWSHSLVMSVVWAAAAFLLVRLLPIYKGPRHTRAALVVAACVLSHWFLDLPMHRPDLPVGFHGPYVGFGIWNNPTLGILVEAAVLIAGFWIYRRKAQRTNYGLLVLALFLLVVLLINTYGPPPQNVAALASSGLAFYIFVAAVAWWLDRPASSPAQ
ncbi:MAG: hypothetical protein ABSH47_08540 [Bryobacteraceae bacterium]|jgi:hypothetical protein